MQGAERECPAPWPNGQGWSLECVTSPHRQVDRTVFGWSPNVARYDRPGAASACAATPPGAAGAASRAGRGHAAIASSDETASRRTHPTTAACQNNVLARVSFLSRQAGLEIDPVGRAHSRPDLLVTATPRRARPSEVSRCDGSAEALRVVQVDLAFARASHRLGYCLFGQYDSRQSGPSRGPSRRATLPVTAVPAAGLDSHVFKRSDGARPRCESGRW